MSDQPKVSLDQVDELLNTAPLKGQALEDYYVDLKPIRGKNIIGRVKRYLSKGSDDGNKLYIYGNAGSGKSTELNRLVKEIKDTFVVVKFSVLEELDILNFNYIDLMVLLLEKTFEAAEKENVKVSDELLKSIKNWLRSEEVKDIEEFGKKDTSEVGGGLDIKYFVRFFATVKASSQYSHSSKKIITETLERKLSDFINRCNDLIREIKINLRNIGKQGLLIITEDLDKMPLDRAVKLFNYNHTLTSLRTNMIFTYPISLIYNPVAFTTLKAFKRLEIPMVKVNTKDGKVYQKGQKGLYDIIIKRIGTSCFEDESLIYRFIEYSGGHIRDLFRMITNASHQALDEERSKITKDDLRKGFYELKREYGYSIAEKVDNEGNTIISLDTYYDTLTKLAKDPEKQVDNTPATLDLRHNYCILSYNDEGWADVHPIVKVILKDRKLIK